MVHAELVGTEYHRDEVVPNRISMLGQLDCDIHCSHSFDWKISPLEISLHNEIQDALPKFTVQNFLQKSRRMQSNCHDAPVKLTNRARSAHTRVITQVLRQAPFGYAPWRHSKPAIQTCTSPLRPMSAAHLARF